MPRTLQEISQQLKDEFVSNDDVRQLYGIPAGEQFSDHFSKVSVESIFIYIVAFCAYFVETLLHKTKDEITQLVESQAPGRTDWYAQKLRGFMYGYPLNDTGEYSIPTDAKPSDIEKARVVKHAVAIDDQVTGVLVLKVAGEDSQGRRVPISADQEQKLQYYISAIKYAGVKTQLINTEGNPFNCEIQIWYNPLLAESEVKNNCIRGIENYLRNLPFNGEYTNMALIDTLQAIEGVKVAECTMAQWIDNSGHVQSIVAKDIPYSGYFNPGKITLNMHAYE